ncbi:MAG: hypothetical protein CME64_09400 [Halobacteriovoraceae bacterium]|nr:hypothetical protein [Halobacteriovoraceae bacterium]|tara:strand:- start:634 stop:2280 length:1647 start_codon:yes stop_codon:yes gene_type:complete
MLATLLTLLFISLSSFSQEAAFDETTPVSAEDERAAENYIHQGLADEKYLEMCKDNETCTSREAFDGGTWATLDTMMPMVSKMYAMFSGLGGGKLSRKVMKNDKPVKLGENGEVYTPNKEGIYENADGKEVSENQLSESKDKTEEKPDVCGYIPMISEAGAMAFQQTQNNTTQNNLQNSEPAARQRASMYALAKTHQDRAKAAKFQFYGWGATASCYAIAMATPAAVNDWKMSAKLGAATFLAYFYNKKKNAHEDKSAAIKKMAEELPKAGDCNPHTDTTCFCAQETSYGLDPSNYMKYCVASELQRAGSVAGVPCVDKTGKADLKCDCKATNSCVNARLAEGMLNLGLRPAQMKGPLQGISNFSTGLDSGKLAPIASKNLAYARKALGKIKTKDKISLRNNPEAKDIATELTKAGLPRGLAAKLASQASSTKGKLPSTLSGSVASFNPYKGDTNAIDVDKVGSNKMKSGSSIRSNRKSKSSNPFGMKRRSSRNDSSGIEIAEYSQKATREAEITKDKSKPIFDIITHRYKMRAWKEFRENIQEHINK